MEVGVTVRFCALRRHCRCPVPHSRALRSAMRAVSQAVSGARGHANPKGRRVIDLQGQRGGGGAGALEVPVDCTSVGHRGCPPAGGGRPVLGRAARHLPGAPPPTVW